MKVKVENFGKIKSAEIDLRKMNLFIGDNNSGKSYLSSLIYGLFNNKFTIYNYLENSWNEHKNEINDFVESYKMQIDFDENEQFISLDKDDLFQIEKYFLPPQCFLLSKILKPEVMGNMWVILHHSAMTEISKLVAAEIEPGTTGSRGPHARRFYLFIVSTHTS